MKKMESLENLFLLEVQDIYNAEKQITRALPKAAKKASAPELKSALEEHLHQTETHVNRLEEVFKILGETPKGHTCAAMKGILTEAEELLTSNAEPEVLDAAIIGAAQKVEHYEIASYGSVIQWAKQMGREDIKQLLGQTLDEEEKTDQKLSDLAKSSINARAMA